MRFVILIIVVFLMHTLSSKAQKMDSYSHKIISKIKSDKITNEKFVERIEHPFSMIDGNIYIDLLVRYESDTDLDIVDNIGTVKVRSGNIYSISILISELENFINNNKVEYIEISRQIYPLNENAIAETNVNLLHSNELGLGKLTGKDVIVGICDTGIDITHPDFKNEDGTRILSIWDMADNMTQNYPEGYNWGTEITKEDIDNELSDHSDIDGHGTHVTGTASGNGNGNQKYKGMAFEADIIFSRIARENIDNPTFTDADIIAGVDYIFKQADRLDKPAVVNLSLGGMLGPKDGTGLLAQALTNLTGEGRIIVTSNGNNGDLPIHSGNEFSSDEMFETMITPINVCEIFEGFCPDLPDFFATAADIWYTGDAIDSVYISAYSYSFGTGETEFLTRVGRKAGEELQNFLLSHEGNDLGYVDMDLSTTNIPLNSSGNAFVFIHNNGNSELPIAELVWSISFKSKAEGDMDMISGIPAIQGFGIEGIWGEQLTGDVLMTLGTPADAENLISVGSYTSRNSWITDVGDLVERNIEVGAVSSFSSLGPTRDGRLKPEVLAPGEFLISAKSADSFGSTVDEKYKPLAGTSMSAPVVSGIIALLLQIDPNLDYETIVAAISATSRMDEYTDQTPNVLAGFGKIDALELAKYLLISNVEKNENSIDRVYVSPNPANEFIRLNSEELIGAKFIIFDINGKAIRNGTICSGDIDISTLQSGSYFLNIVKSKRAITIPFLVSE